MKYAGTYLVMAAFAMSGCSTAPVYSPSTRAASTCSMKVSAPLNASFPNGEFLKNAILVGMPKGLLRSPATEEFIRSVSAPLKSFYSVPDTYPPIRVTVDPVYRGVSTLDNTIYLGLATITQAESDDEVAAIIAHEMGHLACGHMTEKERSQSMSSFFNATRFGTLFVGPAGGAALFGALEGSFVGQYSILAMANGGWSRDQEKQADLMAVDALIAAGYDPTALVTVLGRFPTIKEDPRTPNEKAAEALNQKNNTHLTRDLINAYSVSDYASPAERIAYVLEYLRQAHPDFKPVPRRKAFLDKWRYVGRPTMAALNAIRSANKALRLPVALWGHPELARSRDATAAAQQDLSQAFWLMGFHEKGKPTFEQAQIRIAELNGLKQSLLTRVVSLEIKARSGATIDDEALSSVLLDRDAPEWLPLGFVIGLLHNGERENAARLLKVLQDRYGESPELLPLQIAANRRVTGVQQNGPHFSLGEDMRLTVRCHVAGSDEVSNDCAYAERNSAGEIDLYWKMLVKAYNN